MNTLHQILRHPAGRFGLTLGLLLGFVAALMGEQVKRYCSWACVEFWHEVWGVSNT